MRHVFAEAYISDNYNMAVIFFHITDCLIYNSIFIIGTASRLIFACWNSEKQNCRNTGITYPVQFLIKPVYGILTNPRHGINRIADIFSFYHKYRINQLIDTNMIFSYHTSYRFIFSKSSHSIHYSHPLLYFLILLLCLHYFRLEFFLNQVHILIILDRFVFAPPLSVCSPLQMFEYFQENRPVLR